MKAFTPIIIIALCAGAYYVYLSPAYTEIQALTAKRDQYTGVLEKAKEIGAKRDAILTSYNSIAPDDLDRLKKAIPEKFNPVVFAKYVSGSAAKYGMAVKDVKITYLDIDTGQEVATSAESSYKTMSVGFSVKGTYDQFTKMLKDLESGLYLVDVTSLTLSSDAKTSGASTYNYTVEVHTYSLY